MIRLTTKKIVLGLFGSLLAFFLYFLQYQYTTERSIKKATITSSYNKLIDSITRLSMSYETLVDGYCLKIIPMDQSFYFHTYDKHNDRLADVVRDHNILLNTSIISKNLSHRVAELIRYNNEFRIKLCKTPNLRKDNEQDILIINLTKDLDDKRRRLLKHPPDVYN